MRDGLIRSGLPLLCALAGCLYLPPGWKPVPNQPPEVLVPEPPYQDIPLVMDRDTRITVVAQDPEGDVLDFVWIVPVDVEHDWVTRPEGDLWYSVLTIDADPLLDDRRIALVVSDGFDEVDLSWLVEVP